MNTRTDRKEELIKLFLSERPHQLSYSYRKELYKKDKPALDELIKEGLVRQVHKDTKTILFEYINPLKP